ncbi:MAG: Rrf2 family transcriptional regulator [Acidobacteriaceae bacterium]
MLRLTKKADYGLMALKYIAEHPEEASLSARDIAAAYSIPPQLLAKILQLLARKGLLHSHAGMNGGYCLARNPQSITVFEVVRIIDGPLFITSCVTDAGACFLTSICTIKEPLARVNDSISDVLKNIRISDLVESDPRHGRPKAPAQEPVMVQVQPQTV